MWETLVRSLGWEDPLEEGMADHSSILSWEIPRTEEPDGLWSWGHKGSETMYIYIYTHGSLVAKLSPTLSSSVCGISQAGILEYIYAILYIYIYMYIYIYIYI